MGPTELTPAAWVLLVLAAALVGFAKTAIAGVGSVAVVIFAAVLPARESTGALLPLLLCGDLLAVGLYHRHARWATLLQLLPGVVPGLLLGAWFVAVADDTLMRRSIAAVLLAMTGIQLWFRRDKRLMTPRTGSAQSATSGPPVMVTAAVGVLAGFATMTANAAGPVMTIYLVLAGLSMLDMLGTGAWFFLVVNAAKLPLSAGLHLISPGSLAIDALLVPAMLLGGAAGVMVIKRVDQRQFELAALALGGLAAVLLLL
jgi:uncharacterized membrane protein YfcA